MIKPLLSEVVPILMYLKCMTMTEKLCKGCLSSPKVQGDIDVEAMIQMNKTSFPLSV